jgi:hypothetical protein
MRRRAARQPGRRALVRSVPRQFPRDTYDRKGPAYERIKKRTGCKCEQCRAQCRRPGDPKTEALPAAYIVHQDGRPGNVEDDNLVLVCQACFFRDYYQAKA